ncbi:MAG: DinB family protein [Bacteroidota bacterium]
MTPTPWFARSFPLITDIGLLPTILERLDGTAIRLSTKLDGIEEKILIYKPVEKWSIKEEVGHLWDLEPLWLARMNDILEGREDLTVADLSNRKTHEAGHNERDIHSLIQAFQEERQKLVTLLRAVSEADAGKAAKHPRLGTPMTIMDLAYFVAEHDDHHLARITVILTS